MLKKRELNGHECHALFDLMTHPDVFPFVRQKAYSFEEFMFLTKQTIEAEERGELISRTIVDEWGNPVGTINLFDIHNQIGFLGTWLGKPYHGKGYNTISKEEFLKELFFELNFSSVYMRVKCDNFRSKRAAEKLSYTIKIEDKGHTIFQQLNKNEHIFDLYEVPKDLFTMTYLREQSNMNEMESLEA